MNRGKLVFAQLMQHLAAEWNPSVVLIEDKASSKSLIQELLASTTLPIKPEKVDSDKVTRAYAVTGVVGTDKVYLPASASWLDAFLDETSALPVRTAR